MTSPDGISERTPGRCVCGAVFAQTEEFVKHVETHDGDAEDCLVALLEVARA